MHTAARLKVCVKLESELADHPDYSRQFQPKESFLDFTPRFCLHLTLCQLLKTAHDLKLTLHMYVCQRNMLLYQLE